MSFVGLWLVVGGVLVAGLIALVLAAAAVRGAAPGSHLGLDAARAEPWLAQERTRLLAAALLGAIAAAAAVVVAVRWSWWGAFFLAGSIGAVAVLVAALVLPTPDPVHRVAPPSGDDTWARGVRRRIGLVAGVCLTGVAVAVGAAAVAVEVPTQPGRWGLPHRQVRGVVQDSASAPPRVEYADVLLQPWPGWPDAVASALLVVTILVLLRIVLGRLASEAPAAAEDLAPAIRDQRARVVVGVVTGGAIAQLGVLGTVLGVRLATLTDVDVTTPGDWYNSVAVQPHSTVGAVLATVGAFALVLAIVQLVLAGLGLARLGGSLTSR